MQKRGMFWKPLGYVEESKGHTRPHRALESGASKLMTRDDFIHLFWLTCLLTLVSLPVHQLFSLIFLCFLAYRPDMAALLHAYCKAEQHTCISVPQYQDLKKDTLTGSVGVICSPFGPIICGQWRILFAKTVNGLATLESSLVGSQHVKCRLNYVTQQFCSRICLRKMKQWNIHPHRIYTRMFVVVDKWKQLRSPSAGEQRSQMWFHCATECCWVIKRQKAWMHATT